MQQISTRVLLMREKRLSRKGKAKQIFKIRNQADVDKSIKPGTMLRLLTRIFWGLAEDEIVEVMGWVVRLCGMARGASGKLTGSCYFPPLGLVCFDCSRSGLD